MNSILRAEDVYRGRAPRGDVAEWATRRFPPAVRGDVSRRGGLDSSTPAVAEVNQGRWVARCPFCPSAQVVSPDDPRFLCAGSDGCSNAPVQGAFVPVVFPDAETRAGIEAALLKRPDMVNRNWTAETVDDLTKENEAHGLDHP